MPLEAPVTIAARSAMSVLRRPLLRSSWRGIQSRCASAAAPCCVVRTFDADRCRPGGVGGRRRGLRVVRRQLARDPPPQPQPTATRRPTSPRPRARRSHDLQAGLPRGRRSSRRACRVLDSGATQPLRLRALRRRAQADHRRPGRALHRAHATARGLRGPFVARDESLAVKPQFESQTTADRPRRRKASTSPTCPFTERRQAASSSALARLDGRLVRTTPSACRSAPQGRRAARRRGTRPPHPHPDARRRRRRRLEDRHPRARRPTDLLKTDFADVLGKKPVVLTFATPLLCQSRVCGPVVDVVEQVQADDEGATSPSSTRRSTRTTTVDKGCRPQVARLAPADRALDVRDRPRRRASPPASRARSRPASCSARSPRSPASSS